MDAIYGRESTPHTATSSQAEMAVDGECFSNF